MDWAIDKYTHEEVNADNAFRARNRYICPVCKKDCILRKGYYIRPYFAHISGVGTEACENYHPGQAIDRTYNHVDSRFQSYPKLYIRLHQSNWNLELLIYDYSTDGEIYIPFGLYGAMTISIPHIKVGGIRIPVKTKESYVLQTSEDVLPTFKQMIKSTISGLDASQYTLFHLVNDVGRKLDTGQELEWGQQYIVVWHNKLGMGGWINKDLLYQEQLKSNDPWFCRKICLPDKDDQTIQSWVNNRLNYKIKQPKLTINPLFPIPDKILEDGSLLVLNNKFQLITVSATVPINTFQELIVQSDKQPRKTFLVSTSMPLILMLNDLPLGRTHLWINEDPDVNLSLYFMEHPEFNYSIDNVEFIFKTNDTHETFTLPAFSSSLAKYLRYVQDGAASLIRLSLPKKARFKIYSKDHLSEEWTEYTYSVPPINDNAFEDNLTMKITSFLQHGDLILDFFNYGRVEIITNSKNNTLISLPDWKRKQIKKVIQMTFNNAHFEKKVPFIVSKNILDKFSDEDKLLLNRLLKIRTIPSFLLPLVTKLLQDINTFSASS